MFENIFNIVMDMKVKTKENMKDKMDLPLFSQYGVGLWWVIDRKVQS
jgi:hypothetical protein